MPRASCIWSTPRLGAKEGLRGGIFRLVAFLSLATCGHGFLQSADARGEEIAKKPTAQSLIPSKNANPPVYRHSEGKAQTSMFGLVAEGYKFVYLLDRSGSMGGSGRIALKAVKAELEQSLETLDSIHQFQIIFYNERPVVFNPSGTPGKLAFATDANKERAIRFINSITPDGGTRHDDALKKALQLRPDVIFFLTDGDEPQLSQAQIDEISRRAAGITIHTIEFGMGPKPEEKSFLAKLAESARGQYTYIDLRKHVASPPPKAE